MTGRNGDHIDWDAIADGGRHVIPHDQMWGNLGAMRKRAYNETAERGWVCTVAFTWEGIVIHPRGHPQGYSGRLPGR